MDKRYRNAFDQIHMSAACQARILAAASSADTQEEQSAMKKSKNILKTMLLAAALAGCLSAVAYASNNLLPDTCPSYPTSSSVLTALFSPSSPIPPRCTKKQTVPTPTSWMRTAQRRNSPSTSRN